MKYTAGAFKLEPGDKIFQYTDGVTEATNTVTTKLMAHLCEHTNFAA